MRKSAEVNSTVLADVHTNHRRMGKHLSEALGLKLADIDLMAADIPLSIEEGEASIRAEVPYINH
jgi:hypothetical protein